MAELNEEPGLDLMHMKKSSLSSVQCLLKATNLGNAALLIGAAVNAFLTLQAFNPFVLIVGVYTICFGCLLCCFELHLKRFDRCVFLNFGFMFYWQGRLAFFFFVGSLAFGLATLGYIAGSVTILNVFFNLYVMTVHAGYSADLKVKTQKYRGAAAMAGDLENAGGKKNKNKNSGMGSTAMKIAGGESMNFQDVQNAGKFYKENKETVDQGAQFYKENKEMVDKGAKMAYDNKETVGKAAKAANSFA